MVRRKSVRFGGEDSVSDCSSHVSETDLLDQLRSRTPTKSILVDRIGSASSESTHSTYNKVTVTEKQRSQSTDDTKLITSDFTSVDKCPAQSDSPITKDEVFDNSYQNIVPQLITPESESAAPSGGSGENPPGNWYWDSTKSRWVFFPSPRDPTEPNTTEVRRYKLTTEKSKTTAPVRNCLHNKFSPAFQKHITVTQLPGGRLPSTDHTSPVTRIKRSNMEGSCPTCTYSSGDATRYTMTSGTTGRVEEKQQLQGLNDRLGGYIRHVRDLRQQANQVDSSGFMQSIQILEDELTSLKNVYEKELDNTRRKADDLSREKSHFAVEANKNKNIAAELENRLALESDNSKRVQDDNTGLQMSLIQKEKEVDEARHAIQRPLQELDQLQRAYDDLLRDSETLKRRHNQESGELKQKMDENEQLQQKLQFSCQVHAQETRELKERLNAASTTILSLESNIRELSQSDNSLMDMLQKVRQAAEAELKRYQAEAEQTFTVNMTQIQVQLEESNRKVAELTQLNGEMQGQVGTLNTTIRSLEGKVSGLEHQKASLEDQLSSERGLSHDRMCGLERQLTQLQEALMIKMREVTAARDAHVPLKAELEAFRILLDEEEKRLKVPLGSRGGRRDTGGLTYSPHPPAPAYNARYDDSSLPPVNANMNTARMTSQPLGPVKPRSAPCSAGSMRLRAQSAQSSLGQTSDYFDDMFKDVRVNNDSLKLGDVSPPRSPVQEGECTPPERDVAVRSDQWSRPSSAGQMISPERPPSTNTYDYTTATSSATGNLKIFEVHPQGKYIRLVNTSNDKDEELGQYLLQQNVGGHPVALFRFPPRTRFPAKGTVTVWSGSQDHLLHQPPTDFVVKEQQKWGTGPECTTILCKPNGQAVAWTTAAHRFTSDNYRDSTHYSPPGSVQSDTLDNLPDSEKEQQQKVGGEPPLTEYDMHVNGQVGPTVYMQRDRSCGPSFNPPKHPHGDMPPTPTHPHTGQGRVKSHGNDNSSVNRQTRVQSSKPDPVPGAPYAGASAQRMGSSMLRRYTVRSSGGIANNSIYDDGVATSPPPSAFQKPHSRLNTGVRHMASQHHEDFNPPMPRPPLFSQW